MSKNSNLKQRYKVDVSNTNEKTTSRKKISRKRKLRIAKRVASLILGLTFTLSAGSISLKNLHKEKVEEKTVKMQEVLKNKLDSNPHIYEIYKNNLELAIHYADCMIGQELTDEQIEILADKLKALKKESIRLAIMSAAMDNEYIEDYGCVTAVYYDENNNIIVESDDNGKPKKIIFRTESEEVQSSDGTEPVVKKVPKNVNNKLKKQIERTNKAINSKTELEEYFLNDIAVNLYGGRETIIYVPGNGRGEKGFFYQVYDISPEEVIKQDEERQEYRKNEERQKRIKKELEQKNTEEER